MSNGKFDFGRFATRGDSLYRARALRSPVYDKEYPEISRFDEGGYETDEYLARGLTGSKLTRSGITRTVTGYDPKGEFIERKDYERSVRGGTPRDSYYQFKQGEIAKGMPEREKGDWLGFEVMYGKKPRYGKEGEVVSPHKLFEEYRGKTKGKDLFDKMDIDAEFRERIGSMATSPGIENKIINDMKKIGG